MDFFEYFCDLKRNHMNIRVFIGFILVAAATVCTFSDALAGTPQVKVKVVLTSVSGDSTVLLPGESSPQTLNAPLHAEFISELVADDGKDYVLFPQWTVLRTHTEGETSETENYLKRQESITGFDFTDYGKFQVNFAWSYRDTLSSNGIKFLSFSLLSSFSSFSPILINGFRFLSFSSFLNGIFFSSPL